jgi:uncharacterized membrane protein
MNLIDTIPLLRDIPPTLAVVLISMVPVLELRGAIPLGLLLGLGPLETMAAAIVGNLIPVPFLVWLLDPVQRWLSDHSRRFARFFNWLFARTRRRYDQRYDRLRDLALVSLVAVPLPGTGAWTGSAAAFVFAVNKWRALVLISLGVLIAAIAVTFFLATGLEIVRRT